MMSFSKMDQSSDAVVVGPSLTMVEGNQQLLSLADNIKQNLPFSALMYNMLLVKGRGLTSFQNIYTLADDPDAHVFVSTKKNDSRKIYVYCREHEVTLAMEGLRTSGLIDFNDFVLSSNSSLRFEELLKETVVKKAADLLIVIPILLFTYYQDQDDRQLKCSAGFKLCRLGKAGVHRAMTESKFNKTDNFDALYKYNLCMPCVGVYLDPTVTQDTVVDLHNIPYAGDDELPVSWIVSNMVGTLGMMGTLKHYRRKGLASLVATVAARILHQEGLVPILGVEMDNTASKALFTKTPGWINMHSITFSLIRSDQL